MELMKILSRMGCVSEFMNLENIKVGEVLEGRFFICPKLTGKGYRLNIEKTGFTVAYNQKGEQRRKTYENIERVKRFLNELKKFDVKAQWQIEGIVASAEAKLLFPNPVQQPFVPKQIQGFRTISTYDLLDKVQLEKFWSLFWEKRWEKLGANILKRATQEIANVLSHIRSNKSLVRHFVERVLAEYALEGVWFSERKFGSNPVILGVESITVPQIINSVLHQESKIPLIQLK
jgi:hypothetical protein